MLILNPLEVILVVNLSAMVIISIIGFIWGIREIKDLHNSLNSRLDQLLVASNLNAHAAGVAEEKARREAGAL